MSKQQRRRHQRHHHHAAPSAEYVASDFYPTPTNKFQQYQHQRNWAGPQHDSAPPLQALLRTAQQWMKGDLSGAGHDPNNSIGMGVALLAILMYQFRGKGYKRMCIENRICSA